MVAFWVSRGDRWPSGRPGRQSSGTVGQTVCLYRPAAPGLNRLRRHRGNGTPRHDGPRTPQNPGRVMTRSSQRDGLGHKTGIGDYEWIGGQGALPGACDVVGGDCDGRAATASWAYATRTYGSPRWPSVLVMGIAVCGRHYTGMAAIAIGPQATVPSRFMRSSMDAVSVAPRVASVRTAALGVALRAEPFWSATKHGRRAATVARFEKASLFGW